MAHSETRVRRISYDNVQKLGRDNENELDVVGVWAQVYRSEDFFPF
jgi:hypothetical protein